MRIPTSIYNFEVHFPLTQYLPGVPGEGTEQHIQRAVRGLCRLPERSSADGPERFLVGWHVRYAEEVVCALAVPWGLTCEQVQQMIRSIAQVVAEAAK